jgi:anthranilate/para-aminobenzoate synthase component I
MRPMENMKSFFAAYRAAPRPKMWLGPFGGRVLFGTDLLERIELRLSPEGAPEVWHGPLETLRRIDVDPFDFLEERAEKLGLPAMGFLAYEGGRLFESLPGPGPVSKEWPLLRFDFFRTIREMPLPQTWSASREQCQRPSKNSPPSSNSVQPLVGWPQGVFARKVEDIRQLILEGDVYQVNLVQPFKTAFPTREASILFEALREMDDGMGGFRVLMENPGSDPTTGALGSMGQAILSDSPELFLQRRGMHLQTRPIKGTLRVASKEQAESAAQNLLASTKDRAELAMIVDLMRNDLSRVCHPGSVGVRSFPEILQLPHLVHSQATIEGTLLEGTSLRDCLAATFPCGSISGCPRLRAMQRIEELEAEARGPSFGAIGLLEPSGDFLFSVAIRTALLAHNRLELKAGGGITIDSDPHGEAEESELKTALFQRALSAFSH